ncbi:hypothetical protein L2E82_45361 [Cichorium intybus]|uniref:Uncharacterized protein n=1 Tax=Cichorium intybus TaxID=13427 RepID=A0ACB8ZSW7_CICIN|nr:hypothetical protein L2E82_45361 [Cichorium intybus]
MTEKLGDRGRKNKGKIGRSSERKQEKEGKMAVVVDDGGLSRRGKVAGWDGRTISAQTLNIEILQKKVIDLHNKLGNKWLTIAAKLPGRSDNDIKSRWNIHLKKRAQSDHSVSLNEHVGTLESNHANQLRK